MATLLEERTIRFIEEVATLRNRLAHNVDHYDFSFVTYRGNLSKDELLRYDNLLSVGLKDTERANWESHFSLNSNFSFAAAVLRALVEIIFSGKSARLKRDAEKIRQAYADKFTAPDASN